MFDIRTFKAEQPTEKKEDDFWTVKYLRHVDDYFPKINSECENLVRYKNDKTEDAFMNKVNAWKDFVIALQRLCTLYKIKDAKCLLKKN